MHEAAARIREGVASGQLSDFSTLNPLDLDEIDAPEGRLLARRHFARERSRKLRDRKIATARQDNDQLACEACGFDFALTYGPLGRGYIECHHVIPLHEAGERRTRLEDLALLCSNCHRMIHRQAPWPTPADLRALLREQSSSTSTPRR